MLFGDGLAHVGDRDDNQVIPLRADVDVDVDGGVLEPVFDRILDQVVENLVDFVRIALHHRPVRTVGPAVRQQDSHPALRGARLEAGDHRFHHLQKRHPLVRHDMLVNLDPRQRQQIVDQPRHASGLFLHDLQKTLLRRPVPHIIDQDGLDETGKACQRRAKLMADIGNEIPADLLEVALQRHVEKQHHDQPVIHAPDADIEFHGDACLRGMNQCA